VEEDWRMLQQPTCQTEVWIDDCGRVHYCEGASRI